LYGFAAILFVITFKSVMSGFLSTWVGLLSNRVDLLSNKVGLFSGERVLENTPTPLFEQPLKFITHGHIFKSLRYYTVVTALKALIRAWLRVM